MPSLRSEIGRNVRIFGNKPAAREEQLVHLYRRSLSLMRLASTIKYHRFTLKQAYQNFRKQGCPICKNSIVNHSRFQSINFQAALRRQRTMLKVQFSLFAAHSHQSTPAGAGDLAGWEASDGASLVGEPVDGPRLSMGKETYNHIMVTAKRHGASMIWKNGYRCFLIHKFICGLGEKIHV